MAKRKPTLTLLEMENELGYKVDTSIHPAETVKRFYSDLRPVPDGTYEKTEREFEEYKKMRYTKQDKTISEGKALRLAVAETIAHGEDRVTLRQRRQAGFYRFAVDIHYGFGFDLPLLFTEDEAFQTISAAKLQPSTICEATPGFFNLPREIRDRIYIYALPKGVWKLTDVDNFDGISFPRAIGDPSGFYFPLSKDLVILRVNRQMRQEALPLAYRRTSFRLDDMNDLIKLLIAVGQTGRDDIESLEFPWESQADSECKWDEFPDSDDHFLTLPTLHVTKCVQLLKQCKRLKLLHIHFESELMLKMPIGSFKADPGIRGLCSIRGIERVEIWSLGNEPLGQCCLAKWLKETIKDSGKGGRKIGCGEKSLGVAIES